MATTVKKLASTLLFLSFFLTLGGSLVLAPRAEAFQSLLFPFVTTETGKFTFITIANDGAQGGEPVTLHFSYAMKAVPVVNQAGCEHFDGDVGSTRVDMMIFEANRKVTDAGLTALFEGAGATTSTPLAFPVADRAGFLIVESVTGAAGVGGGPYLFGSAAVVDSGTGLTFGYSTNYSTSVNLNGTAPGGADFSGTDGGLYVGGVAATPFGGNVANTVGQSGFKNAAWYPTSIVSTSWFVLPLSTRAVMAPSGGGGIRLALRTATDHLPTPNLQGAYDLDEAFFSGGRGVNVRCFGLITRGSFLQPAVDAAVAGGGFTFVASNGANVTTSPTDAVDPSATYSQFSFSLYRLQSTTALGAPRATIHQEPDHNPCFNPTGAVGVVGVCN